MEFKDKLYWFWRNGSATICGTVVMPIYFFMFALEALRDGIKATIEADGSTEIQYPWEFEWPLFRETA